tara:strand:- start:248 stop:1177 length:930 start_codon:yes stop_codon:yes gene_type:complete
MITKQISFLFLAILLQVLFFIYPLSGNSGILFNLFLLCPLPLYFLGILFGYRYVIFASIPAILIIYSYGVNIAIAYFFLFAIPSVYLSYFIGLNKTTSTEDNEIIWYPLSLIFSKIIMLSLILSIIGILFLGTNIVDYNNTISAIYSDVYQIRPDLEETIQLNNIALMSASLPSILVAFWIMIFLVNLWIATKITKKVDGKARSWDGFDEISLPKNYIYLLIVFLALAFVTEGIIKVMSITGATAILVGYSINGLSVLHNVTKNFNLRPLVLTTLYILVLLFVPFIIPVTILGIMDYKNNLRNKIKSRR